MTADELNKMQQDAKKRHGFVEKEKSMTEVLNENFDFIDGELLLKNRKQRPMVRKPHTPQPVQNKIIRSKNTPLQPEIQKWERPKANYSNSKSSYGIFDELKEEWNKKKVTNGKSQR